jgi:hypothetical protein
MVEKFKHDSDSWMEMMPEGFDRKFRLMVIDEPRGPRPGIWASRLVRENFKCDSHYQMSDDVEKSPPKALVGDDL